jgi:hypothetical protein
MSTARTGRTTVTHRPIALTTSGEINEALGTLLRAALSPIGPIGRVGNGGKIQLARPSRDLRRDEFVSIAERSSHCL